MWIKRPSEKLRESEDSYLNFLFKYKKSYIMDNHLAAGWAWLNQLDCKNTYNLVHIDRHYDLLDFEETMNNEIISKGVKIDTLTLDEYLALKQPIGNGEYAPMFRWDNYIGNLHIVYPNFFGLCYFATHEDGNTLENFINCEATSNELIDNIEHWILSNDKNKWIINIDIDYFFDYSSGQILSDEYIITLCIAIKKVYNKIKVVTICLSPECCGGWPMAIEKTRLICEILEIKFEWDQLNLE
jgi:hypothetical protein